MEPLSMTDLKSKLMRETMGTLGVMLLHLGKKTGILESLRGGNKLTTSEIEERGRGGGGAEYHHALVCCQASSPPGPVCLSAIWRSGAGRRCCMATCSSTAVKSLQHRSHGTAAWTSGALRGSP